MKRKACLTAAIGVFATLGISGVSIGIVGTAEASSSRLAGQSFQVTVRNLEDGQSFSNCYIFVGDGTWIDPLFLDPSLVFPGTWVEHGGSLTRYTSFAKSPAIPEIELPPLRLIQNGWLYTDFFQPARMRLTAYSTVVAEIDGVGDVVVASFLSRGISVDECPAAT